MLFFEIIQLAIGKRKELSKIPSEKEWKEIFDLSIRHSMLGILFAAFHKVLGGRMDADRSDTSLKNVSDEIFFQTLFSFTDIQKSNRRINKRCVEIQSMFAEAGMKSTILKGQGIAAYYKGLAACRSYGDIDIWVDAPQSQIIDFVRTMCPQKETDVSRKHVEMPIFEDVTVEVHFIPSEVGAYPQRKRLRQFYEQQKAEQMANEVTLYDKSRIITPTHKFNAVFILNHIFDHFLFEGIGMRQVMDWYFVMSQSFSSEEQQEIVKALKDAGLYRFATAMTDILVTVFRMSRDELFIPPQKRLGKKVLNYILEEGTAGILRSEGEKKQQYSTLRRFFIHTQRQFQFIDIAPAEVLWSPINRVRTYFWRLRNGYISK